MATLQWGRSPSRSVGVHVAFCLLAIVLLQCARDLSAAPVEQTTELETFNGETTGCYYNFQHYNEGDRILTNEPCLNCTCHNRMLMCYLRVCPFTKAIGQDCKIEKRPDQCCPIISCPEVPVQLLTSTTTLSPATDSTAVGHLDHYGCTINELFYSDGARVPSDPNKPCELCYCIRNRTACVMQECTLHVEGCQPVYQEGVCCPVRYDCDQEENLLLETTVRPTPGLILTTTLAPGAVLDCTHNGEIYSDGALIPTDQPCEHCYCMRSEIVCAVQDCGTPLEHHGKNCTAVPPREGQCCPETYECDNSTISTDEITTDSTIETTEHILDDHRNEEVQFHDEETTDHSETHEEENKTTASPSTTEKSKDEESIVSEQEATTEIIEDEHHEMHVTESDLLHPKPESDNSVLEHDEHSENEIPIKPETSDDTLKPVEEQATSLPESPSDTTESEPHLSSFVNRFNELDHTTETLHEEATTGSEHDNEIPIESDNVLTNEVHHDEITQDITTAKSEDYDSQKPVSEEETHEDDSSKTEAPQKTVHSKLDVESEVPTTESHLEDEEPSQTETNQIPNELTEGTHDSNEIDHQKPETITESHESSTDNVPEEHHDSQQTETPFVTHDRDQTEEPHIQEPEESHVPTSFPEAESSTEHHASDELEHDVQKETTETEAPVETTDAHHDSDKDVSQNEVSVEEESNLNAIPQHQTESEISEPSTEYSAGAHLITEETASPIEHKPEQDIPKETSDEQTSEKPEHDVKLEDLPVVPEHLTETYFHDVTESHPTTETLSEEKPEVEADKPDILDEQKPLDFEDHSTDSTPFEHDVTETAHEHKLEVTETSKLNEHESETTEAHYDHKPETLENEKYEPDEPQTTSPVESKPETVESDETTEKSEFEHKHETTETSIKSEPESTEAPLEHKPVDEGHKTELESEAPIDVTTPEYISHEHSEDHQPEVHNIEASTSLPVSDDFTPDEATEISEHKPEHDQTEIEESHSEADLPATTAESVPELNVKDRFPEIDESQDELTQAPIITETATHSQHPEEATHTALDSNNLSHDKLPEVTTTIGEEEKPPLEEEIASHDEKVEEHTSQKEDEYHTTEQSTSSAQEIETHKNEAEPQTILDMIHKDKEPEEGTDHSTESHPTTTRYTPDEHTADEEVVHDIYPEKQEPIPEEVQRPEEDALSPIEEVIQPIPHAEIPGEGDCLVDGITYHNNSEIPPVNHCHVSCHCTNSIVHCRLIECSPPPPNMINCVPIPPTDDSCCPAYYCEGIKNDILESGNQMMEHNPTVPSKPIEDDNKVELETANRIGTETTPEETPEVHHDEVVSSHIPTESSVEEKHTTQSVEVYPVYHHPTEANKEESSEEEASVETSTSSIHKDHSADHSLDDSQEVITEISVVTTSSVSDTTESSNKFTLAEEEKHTEFSSEEDDDKRGLQTTKQPEEEKYSTTTSTAKPVDDHHETTGVIVEEITTESQVSPSKPELHEHTETETEKVEIVNASDDSQEEIKPEIIPYAGDNVETSTSYSHHDTQTDTNEVFDSNTGSADKEPQEHDTSLTEQPTRVTQKQSSPEEIAHDLTTEALVEPEKVTEEPSKVHEEPETEEPETVHDDLEKGTEEPEKVHEEPEIETEEPEKIHGKPEVETNESDKVDEQPEVETEEPEKVHDIPEVETQEPEKLHEEPEKDTEKPEIVHEEPEKETEEPEKVHEEPEKETEEPEKVHEEPEKETEEPEKVHEEPERETEEPERIHEKPEKVHDEPEVETEEPEKVHEEPEVETEEPEIVHEEPEVETEEPEKVHEEPEVETEEPEKVHEEPEVETEEPEKVYAEPEKDTEEPEKVHEEPEKETEEPEKLHEEPEKDTEEPEKVHEEPEKETEEPEKLHEEPEQVTDKPEKVHEEPVKEIEGVGETHEEPAVIPEEPAIVTGEPEKVYEEPSVATEEPEKDFQEPEKTSEESQQQTEEPEKVFEEPDKEESQPHIEDSDKATEEPTKDSAEPEKIHDEVEESHITTLSYEEVTDSKVEPEIDDKIVFPVEDIHDQITADATTSLPSHEEHVTQDYEHSNEVQVPVDYTTEHPQSLDQHHDVTSDKHPQQESVGEETTEKINDRFGDQAEITTEGHHEVSETTNKIENIEDVVTESHHKDEEISQFDTTLTSEEEHKVEPETTTEIKEHVTTEKSHEKPEIIEDEPSTESRLPIEPVNQDFTTEHHKIETEFSTEASVLEASTEHEIHTSKPIETTHRPAFDSHTEKEIDVTTEKEVVSSTELNQEPNYVQVPIEDHQKPIEDYSTHIPPPAIPGEGIYQKPVDPDYSVPSHATGFGSHPDHNLEYPGGADDTEDYYDDHTSTFGPGTCRYGGKVYVSAQQIPRDDPCDFCFCFRSDIICLQQSCPPPIPGCHEEPIQGFCCPRYECPVSMATVLNTTTTTTTTTTTLPPHFLPHAYKGAASRRGCQIQGQAYQVGEVVRSKSGPCLHCTCGGDGQMKCDPKVCSPQPMIQQMIAAAAASRRR